MLTAAQEQAREGNFQGAVDKLTDLLHGNEKPGGDAPYQLLAGCFERLNRLDRAIETARDGLRQYPKSAALERTLGELLFHQDTGSAEAGQLLSDAVKADPQDPAARHYYAQWASLNNRDQLCAEQEQMALRLRGLNDLALLQMNALRGICLSHLDQGDAAQLAFRTAFEIDLHQRRFDPAMAYQYIQFLTSRGQKQEAEKVVDETLSRSPEFGPVHLERAKALDHERQTEKAIDEAKAALAGEGNDNTNIRAAHALLAKSYFILGNTREAEAEQRWVEAHAGTQP